MLLQTLSQRDVVKVVEGVDGRSQTLVVFLLDEQVVQCLVDCLVVVVLCTDITLIIIIIMLDLHHAYKHLMINQPLSVFNPPPPSQGH